MSDSPWMTTQQVAAYSQLHENRVLEALKDCHVTSGRTGLRGYQRATRTSWRIHRDDADRWIRGEPPVRGTRRFDVARSA